MLIKWPRNKASFGGKNPFRTRAGVNWKLWKRWRIQICMGPGVPNRTTGTDILELLAIKNFWIKELLKENFCCSTVTRRIDEGFESRISNSNVPMFWLVSFQVKFSFLKPLNFLSVAISQRDQEGRIPAQVFTSFFFSSEGLYSFFYAIWKQDIMI